MRGLRHLLLIVGLLAGAMAGSAQAADPLPPVTAADRFMGRPDAPVTVVEYSSFVCPHCATWHIATLPEFRALYIDTGQVRLVMRDMLTNPVQEAANAAAIARCATPERYFDVAHELFLYQSTMRNFGPVSDWYDRAIAASGRPPVDMLACMQSPTTMDPIFESVTSGSAAGVAGTPTFFVNGVKVDGNGSMEALSAAIQPHLTQ